MGHEWTTDRPFFLPAGLLGRYQPVLPGDPSFVCRAAECDAWCCRALSVPVDDNDAQRLERHSGLERSRFLESEAGVPIELPLVEPYLLARRDGHCALLGSDLRCSQYDGRPDACRAYPFQLLLINRLTGQPASAHAGGDPVLIRHLDCPGFTGPPLDAEAWRRLVDETALLSSRAADAP